MTIKKCHLQYVDECTRRCIRCGMEVKSRERPWKIVVECRAPAAPSAVRKLGKFAMASAKWIAAGSPVRADDTIDEIYEQICTPCAHFNNGSCTLCGCHLKAKIRMGTEECPIGKWE